jgi:hypothetical protein
MYVNLWIKNFMQSDCKINEFVSRISVSHCYYFFLLRKIFFFIIVDVTLILINLIQVIFRVATRQK